MGFSTDDVVVLSLERGATVESVSSSRITSFLVSASAMSLKVVSDV